jgi:hypothetical protein
MTSSRLAVLLVSVSLGCSAAPRPVTTVRAAAPPEPPRFPTPAELAVIAEAPSPAITSKAVDVPTWELAGPFPGVDGAASAIDPGPWGALLAAGTQAGTFTPAASAHCVARELGRFYLRHMAPPTERLRLLMDGWCGNTAVSTEVRFYGGTVPPPMRDAAVLAQWRQPVADLVAAMLPAPGAQAGIWYGREDGRAVVAIARAVPWATLEPASAAPDADGAVIVRGTVLFPVAEARILVNRGPLAVASCPLEPGVALPRFAARCMVDPTDPVAWIELTAVQPGRVLGKVVARVLARRDTAAAAYALADPIADEESSAGADADALTALVNRVRGAAGLRALAIEPEQSAQASRLAPHFFAGALGADPSAVTDRISLGLMAGWGVRARVASADLFTTWTTDRRSRALLAATLDSPAGRSVLLDPTATHLAIGDLDDAVASLRGSLFVTYRALPDNGRAAHAAVAARIQAERSKRGHRALRLVAGAATLDTDVAAALRAESPEVVLDGLLAEVARQSGGTVQGAYAIGPSVTDLPLPADTVTGGADGLLVVAPYRPTGGAWWSWAMFLVVGDGLQGVSGRVPYRAPR